MMAIETGSLPADLAQRHAYARVFRPGLLTSALSLRWKATRSVPHQLWKDTKPWRDRRMLWASP
ncbi:hypothetical protein SAMN07250955_11145 [Arboricoccus pini]|uniref:Uncharacterized protein n=1 Tax=Arboricoccus pini TaxID=1963835 RepID=A0A212RN33_9PROT|nr:hypothetical protein SAMN07250955_11145 [Arboricoccus pini]